MYEWSGCDNIDAYGDDLIDAIKEWRRFDGFPI
jgi:hypothetical protein